MTSFEPVRSVQRGLSILRAVSEHGPVSITDLVSLCPMPQPTVVRMLETLMEAGYVYRQPGRGLYRVTGRTLALSRGFEPHDRLTEVARPVIEQLHVDIGWPSNLAVHDNGAMVIIYSNRAALGLSIPGRIGARVPMLATGVGRVALAFMQPAERDAALEAARIAGDPWVGDGRRMARLPAELQEIRRQGHAFADEEYLDAVYQSRIWAVAVPIMAKDRVRGALSSLVLRIAGERRRLLKQILPRLGQAAAEVSGRIESDLG